MNARAPSQANTKAAHAAVRQSPTDLLGNPGMPMECFAACFSPVCFLWGCARTRPAYPKSEYVAPASDPA
jgi:hypothetical protein